MSTPLVSVVMSVYNGLPYLKASVESILNQTYSHFEFIIIDDCSTDGSLNYLSSLTDKRIRLLHNSKNLKLSASLNLGIQASRGRYILRMDADDISFSDRLEKQVRYMEHHPEAAMAYCDMLYFDSTGILPDFNTNSHNPEDIRTTLLFYNVVNHNGVIFRRNIISKYTYNPDFTVTEDLDLWIRFSKKHSIYYMPQNLVLYRVHKTQATQSQRPLQFTQEAQIKRSLLKELLGTCTPKQEKLHQAISSKRVPVSSGLTLSWLHYLDQQNGKTGLYPRNRLRKMLLRMFLTVAVYNKYEKKECISGLLSFGPITALSFFLSIIYNGAVDFFFLLVDTRKGRRLL